MSIKREKNLQSKITQSNMLNRVFDKKVTLRKKKIEDMIFKKRCLADVEPKPEITSTSRLYAVYTELQKEHYSREKLKDYCEMIKSNDQSTVLQGLLALRRILATPVDPPIEEIISNGTASTLLHMLTKSDESVIIFEILWIITNIASGDCACTKFLCDHGIIPIIEGLISPPINPIIADQVIWVIANISADERNYRIEMMERHFLEFLISILIDKSMERYMKNTLWAISNMLRDVKELKGSSDHLCYLVYFCCRVIKNYARISQDQRGDNETYVHSSILILCFLTDCSGEFLRMVSKNQATGDLISLMDVIRDDFTYHNLIRIIGNYSSADHGLTSDIVENGIIPKLKDILENDHRSQIRKESCWILSNIAAGLEEHINQLIEFPGMLELLFTLMKSDSFDVKKEGLWCTANLTSTNNKTHLITLFNQGILDILNEWVDNEDFRISSVCMEAMENLLGFFNSDHVSRIMRHMVYINFDTSGLVNKLEKLTQSSMEIVSDKSTRILEDYFSEGEIDTNENWGEGCYIPREQESKIAYNEDLCNNGSDDNDLGILIKDINKENESPESDEDLSVFL